MELFPQLKMTWLNGWLALMRMYAVVGLLMAALPREVVRRLYDRSGWSKQQRTFSIYGKLVALGMIVLLIFSPLSSNLAILIPGAVVYGLGIVMLMWALFTYRRTPLDRPVTGGLYRISRNPQWVGLVLVFWGIAIATGTWLTLLLMAVLTPLGHFRIRGEEQACLAQYGESYRKYMEQVPRYFLFF